MSLSRAALSTLAAALLLSGATALQADERDREAAAARKLPKAKIQFMMRGYIYAGNGQADPKALGGYGRSKNLPKALEKSFNSKDGALQLIALTDQPRAFGEVQGFRVVLVNRSGQQATLAASDSRLSIIREAKNAKGEWKPLGYLPSSWCGNSYHSLYLEDDHFWDFVAPRFDGPLETEMRFRLKRGKGQDLVSETFKGKIHPDQFTVKKPYKASNLMDPYED